MPLEHLQRESAIAESTFKWTVAEDHLWVTLIKFVDHVIVIKVDIEFLCKLGGTAGITRPFSVMKRDEFFYY